jgi:hypothetical protein
MRAVSSVCIAAVLGACSSSTGPGGGLFVAHVDSITTPNVMPASGPMRLVIFYNLFTGGSCNRFDHLQSAQTLGTLDLTVMGYHSPGPCPAVPVPYPLVTFDAQPPFTTPFVITAHQGDGTTLSRTLYGAD